MIPLLRKFWTRLTAIVLRENWMIGIIDAPIESSLGWTKTPPVRWIGPRSHTRYLADPFAWPGRDNVLFCEEYNYHSCRGKLKEITLDGDRIAQETLVDLPLPGHLSYPFLFAHSGEVYCLPESSAARKLALFHWQNGQWQEHSVVLPDTAAADSTLFTHNDFFWIAYTDTARDPFDHLHVCYASSLEGPWTQHPGNPVRTSLTNARCGGTPFRVGDKLYRPAQDCSETYGGSIRIMEITECTPSAYNEKEACHVKPAPGLNPHGFHTLSSWGNRCLVDGKRLEFSLASIAQKIRQRLSRLVA